METSSDEWMDSLNANKRTNAKTLVLILALLFALFLLISSFEIVYAVPRPFTGDIRITPEGTVEGTDMISQKNNVYTLMGDISGSTENGRTFISIEKDGVILDGASKAIKGTGTGVAITLHGRKDVTIKNLKILNFGTGIELRAVGFESNSTASNNRILDNYIQSAYWGIDLHTDKGFVSGNTIISKNSIYGVNFQANNTIFINNAFTNGGLILFNTGMGNQFSGNTINGKPLIYLERQSDQIIDGANQVILVDCNNLIVRNVDNSIDFRVTIQLFGTTNTRITNSKGNIALTNSHSNTIFNNELSESGSMATYDSAVIKLTNSNNNTITQNSITGTNSFGISLTSSTHNNIQKNTIICKGSDKAGIKIEMSPGFRAQYNYINENNITSEHYGLYFRAGASYNFVYKNSIINCKNAIMLSSAYNNQFIGNNISKSTQYAVSLGTSDHNTFYYNNFVGNAIQAYEMHELYWFTQNNTYYSENNTWDNGKEGNYWSGYSGSDTNGDGIGETPHNVYEAFTDRYPLTAPYNINKIVINREKWIPTQNEIPQLTDQLRIVILSPENITYNTTSVALNVTTSVPCDWLGISTDFQSNTTISGNITLYDLTQGPHSLTVYGNTSQGVNASSETIYFTIDAPESFPIIPVTTLSVAIIAVSSAGVALYLKKHKI